MLERATQDIRDRATTPADWYEPFRPGTWDEAMELVSQEMTRIPASVAPILSPCFQSAKCTNEENYLAHAHVPGAFRHQQHRPLHPPLSFHLGCRDEAGRSIAPRHPVRCARSRRPAM